MAVAIKTAPSFQASTPTVLFNGAFNLRSDSGISYDVDSRHKRFVMIRRADGGHAATDVRVVLSWFDDFRNALR